MFGTLGISHWWSLLAIVGVAFELAGISWLLLPILRAIPTAEGSRTKRTLDRLPSARERFARFLAGRPDPPPRQVVGIGTADFGASFDGVGVTVTTEQPAADATVDEHLERLWRSVRNLENDLRQAHREAETASEQVSDRVSEVEVNLRAVADQLVMFEDEVRNRLVDIDSRGLLLFAVGAACQIVALWAG